MTKADYVDMIVGNAELRHLASTIIAYGIHREMSDVAAVIDPECILDELDDMQPGAFKASLWESIETFGIPGSILECAEIEPAIEKDYNYDYGLRLAAIGNVLKMISGNGCMTIIERTSPRKRR